MSRSRQTSRLLLIVFAVIAPSTARLVESQAVATPATPSTAAPATPADLRTELTLAYARTYSIAELLIGATKTYSVACNDPKSYTTLMMIDMLIARAIVVKQAIAENLATAAGIARKDAGANELANHLVGELDALSSAVASIMEPAKRCETWMREQARAANAASADGDSSWDAARMHASINVTRLADLDVTAEMKEARLLVERTK